MKVLVISSGPPMSQRVLYCLHNMGATADLIDIGPISLARYSRYRRRYARFKPTDASAFYLELTDFVCGFIRRNSIDAVVGADISAAGVVHRIKEALTAEAVVVFPVSDAETHDLLDNKWRFQRFMEKYGIPCPRGVLISQRESDCDLGLMNFPLICKPLFGESSHGVVMLRDRDELKRHLSVGGRYAEPPLLLQEYAPGFDADLSVLAVDGVVHAHVLQSRRDPASLEFIAHDAVLSIGRRIVQHANYSGVANIDVRIDEIGSTIRVLECNPRFWYTLNASLWRGLNFVRAGLEISQGARLSKSTVAGGRYYRHKDLLKGLVTCSLLPWEIDGYNFAGLWQSLSDPLPIIRGCFH